MYLWTDYFMNLNMRKMETNSSLKNSLSLFSKIIKERKLLRKINLLPSLSWMENMKVLTSMLLIPMFLSFWSKFSMLWKNSLNTLSQNKSTLKKWLSIKTTRVSVNCGWELSQIVTYKNKQLNKLSWECSTKLTSISILKKFWISLLIEEDLALFNIMFIWQIWRNNFKKLKNKSSSKRKKLNKLERMFPLAQMNNLKNKSKGNRNKENLKS